MLAELVSGTAPGWQPNSLDTLVLPVAGALGEIVKCATAERPGDRFGSAKEFATILEALARSMNAERSPAWQRELER